MDDKNISDEIIDAISECSEEENTIEDYFFIPIDITEQAACIIDNIDFQKGIKDYSYTCGAITALCNVGLNPDEAVDFIIHTNTMKHNMEVTKIGSETTIESAKYASIKSELDNL